MEKTTSQRRQEASRRNGALSRGPVTPEGKARSSRNAVRHGCLATLLTFTPEQADAFNHIHAEYIARFEPRDQVEHDLVEEIANAKWQIRQAWIYQSALLGIEQVQTSDNVDRAWKSLGPHDREALAFQSFLARSNAIPNLQRYARSHHLQAERSIKLLMTLQKQPLPPAVEPDPQPFLPELPNKPNPIPGHLDPPAATPELHPSATAQPAGRPGDAAVPVASSARQVYAYAFAPPGPRRLPESTSQHPLVHTACASAASSIPLGQPPCTPPRG